MKSNICQLTTLLLISCTNLIFAQIGINTVSVNPSAALEIKANNKGLLLPRIALLSTDDITTIPNPARGLMIYNLSNSPTAVAENKKVFANLIYTFNGSMWTTVLSDDTGVKTINLPTIYARGRKTTTETPCSGNNASFALNERDSNILADGKITANKAGFYKFNITNVMYFNNNAGRNPVIGYTKNNDGNSLSFDFRKDNGIGYDNFRVSYSGVVYLTNGEISGGFSWALGGNNNCTTSDRIRQQEVIWEYLGDI